ncbi:MAG: ABC transporter permease [Gemmatimonadales bacterium]
MIWALVSRSLGRHPVRTALVVAGIAVAAALLLDMVMLSGGMERSFSRMLLSRGFQIRLSPKGTLPFDTEATIPGISAILTDLRADPAVERAGPVLAAPVHIGRGDSLVSYVAYGLDPIAQGLYELEAGTDLGADDTTGMVVGAAAAAAGGWAIGDTVRVLGRLDPQSAEPGVERRLVVRGRVRFLYDARDQRSLAAQFRVVQQLGRNPDRDPAAMVMVKAIADSAVEPLAARIAARHPTVEVNSVAALVARFRNRLAYFQQLSLILATISLVVGVLLIGTILTITVSERTGEFAVLRAVGMRRRRVIRLVVVEGALLTAVGTTLGIGLGLATARYLDAILTSFPGLPAAISFFVPDPTALGRAAVAVLVAGLAAAAYPAWLASRAPIAETLRADAE